MLLVQFRPQKAKAMRELAVYLGSKGSRANIQAGGLALEQVLGGVGVRHE